MTMMHVERVRMSMGDGVVPVRMRMLAGRIDVVRVIVVMVAMRVRMIVLDRAVRVLVRVALGEVKPQPRHEEETRPERDRTGRPLAEAPGQEGPDEGSGGEDRTRSAQRRSHAARAGRA